MSRTLVAKPDTVPVWAESGEKVKPSNPEIAEGWPLSATPPSRQRFNWILGQLAQMAEYNLQHGIPKWSPEQLYAKDAVVVHDGKLWVALQQNIGADPKTSPAQWADAAKLIQIGGDSIENIIKQLMEKDVSLEKLIQQLIAKDINLQEQINALKGGTGISVTIGDWLIQTGAGATLTGYLDEVTMAEEMEEIIAITITEGNAIGWLKAESSMQVTEGPTVFGTTRHPTDHKSKFLISCARWSLSTKEFIYAGGVAYNYIAYGKRIK